MSDPNRNEQGLPPNWIFDVSGKELFNMPYEKPEWAKTQKKEIPHSELMAFYETIPESMRVHLTESQVEEEHRHHYGKP